MVYFEPYHLLQQLILDALKEESVALLSFLVAFLYFLSANLKEARYLLL